MQKYEKQFEITSDECNEYGKLRLRSLFNLFQAMADNHAHLLGVGYQYCIQNGLGWIGGYFVGWSERNAAPKQAENVGVGSVIPRSVPASLAVKPERQ